MSAYSGDFLGFLIGNTHSSLLNITRVSNGNRYSEDLLPNFNDATEQVPGADGTYYWNTYYTKRPFTIDFAFDNLHDEDIRRLKLVLNFKGVQPLIFDESMYKKYYVKCSAPPTLKYIGFTDNETILYKGEGSLSLVAYYPYALSTMDVKINGGTELLVANNGDLEAPMKIYYKLNDLIGEELTLELNNNNNKIEYYDAYRAEAINSFSAERVFRFSQSSESIELPLFDIVTIPLNKVCLLLPPYLDEGNTDIYFYYTDDNSEYLILDGIVINGLLCFFSGRLEKSEYNDQQFFLVFQNDILIFSFNLLDYKNNIYNVIWPKTVSVPEQYLRGKDRLNNITKMNIEISQQLNNKDKYICIDTRTHLIEGLDENYNKTNTLYNRFITSGDFFLLPIGQNTFTSTIPCEKIEYNYLYY